MKKRLKQIILSFLLIGSTFSVTAQQNYEPMQKNTFFVELLGNGMFYSLNYDRVLVDEQNWKVSGRIGMMYFPGFKNSSRQIAGSPVEVSYWIGKNSHYFEVGLGFTPIYDTYQLTESHIRDLAVMGVA